MPGKITIQHPELLKIKSLNGTAIGGDQDWYADRWHRMAGCGPVAASNLIWYLSRSRPSLASLCNATEGTRPEFLTLMDEMFTYVTPGRQGVNTTKMFVPGLRRYCSDHGFLFDAQCLEVGKFPRRAPSLSQMGEYLTHWLSRDYPVAFLNLSNGALKLPESWHWVTITGIDPDSMTAQISDAGQIYEANMETWLNTSMLGGALVALYEPSQSG